MVILATTVVITLSNTGIINTANKSTFVSNIKEVINEYSIYQAFYLAEGNKLSDLNVSSSDIHTVIKSLEGTNDLKDKLKIEQGEIVNQLIGHLLLVLAQSMERTNEITLLQFLKNRSQLSAQIQFGSKDDFRTRHTDFLAS
jgi:hypothetical protein